MGVGVLDRNEAGDRLVRIGRVPEGFLQLTEVPRPVRTLGHLLDRCPDDDGVAGLLVVDDVGARPGDGFLAPTEMAQLRDQICHGAAGHEKGRFLAEHFGGTVLESVDRWIVAKDVVAKLGFVHGLAHGRGGVCDGVAAQVDHAVAAFSSHGAEYRSAGPAGGFGSRTRGERADGRHQEPDTVLGHLLSFALGVGSWCSGLTCQPVTLEIAGSNPVEPAIQISHLLAPSPPGRGSSLPALGTPMPG